MTIDRHEVAIFQNLVCMTDTVHAGDAELSRNDRTMNQHTTTAFDNGARKRDQVSHSWLDRFADENLALPKTAEVVAPANAANHAGDYTG